MASTGISWRHVPRWAHAAGRAIDGAMAALIVTSPVAIGGMLPWAQAVWSIGAIAVLAAAAGVHGATGARWRWEAATVVLIAVAAFTLIRASTIAAFLGGSLEHDVYAIWPHVDPTGTAAPGRAPLAAIRLLGLAAIFQVASVRFRGRDGGARTTKIALGACGLVAAIGVLHAAFGLTETYGLYEAQHVVGLRAPLAAPFINENQAGAMWGLGAVLLVGVAVYDTKLRVFGMIGAAAALGCTEFLLHSHGAATAAVAASVMMLAGINMPEMRSRTYGRLLTGAGIAVLTGCALVSWLVVPAIPMDSVVIEKATMWRDSLIPALSRPLGFGPGAYADLYGTFATHPKNTRFAFVESAPLQIAVDHGWIAAIAIIGVLLAVFLRRMRFDSREERDLRAVTLGVVTYIGVEAITGMGLEGMGYAFPVAALAGMTAGRSITRSKQNAARSSIVGGALVAIIITGIAIRGLGPSIAVGDDHVGDTLVQIAQDSGRDSAAMRDAMYTLAESVPADTMLLTHSLAAALRAGDIDRAEQIATLLKQIAPGRPVTWDFAVDVHLARADDVAACAAIQQMIALGGGTTRVVQSLSRVTDNPMDWQQCANHADSLHAIYDGLHRQGRTDDALAIALRELRGGSNVPTTLRAAFRGYHALGLTEQAIAIGQRLLEEDPGEREIVIHTARLLVGINDFATAIEVLDRARATGRTSVSLRLERLAVFLLWVDAPSRSDEFVTEFQQLLASASRHRGNALRRLRLGAAFFAEQERWIEAESAYRGILRLAPGDPGAIRGLDRVTDARGR